MNKPSLRKVKPESLLRFATSAIVQRGRIYHTQRRARVETASDDTALVSVAGSRPQPYQVRIQLLDEGRPDRLVRITCDCPYAEGLPTEMCKHKVAALLELNSHFMKNPVVDWKAALGRTLSRPSRSSGSKVKELLVFSLRNWGPDWNLTALAAPATLLPKDASCDPDSVAAAMEKEVRLPGVHRFQSVPAQDRLINATPAHVAAAGLLVDRFDYYRTGERAMAAALPLLDGSLLYSGSLEHPFESRLILEQQPGILEMEVTTEESGCVLTTLVRLDGRTIRLERDKTHLVCKQPPWLLAESTLFRVDASADLLESALTVPQIAIPADETPEFLERFVGPLAERMPVRGVDLGEWEDLETEPQPRVYLTEISHELRAEARFGYAEYELPYDPSRPAVSIKHDAAKPAMVRIHRDPEREEEAWHALSSYGLKRGPERTIYVLRQKTSAVDFLVHHMPRLAQAGYEVFGEEALKSVRVNRNRPKMSLSVSSGIDWFDVQAMVTFGETSAHLTDLRKALRKRERYIKLADGSIGEIPPDWIQRYRYLFDLGSDSEGSLRLTKSQVALLDDALTQADSAEVDAGVERWRERLRDFTGIAPHELPQDFTGELRHYQKAGYDWLHFLHEYELGGCLADDMGIGKTIQALALLQSLRGSGHTSAADLIVMPRSLLSNWAREAQRFTPSLRVLEHANGDRARDMSEFDGYDLVLTTYGIMLRDIDALKGYRFHYVVLDESQAVKNPLAHTSRAVRLLQGDHKLVLTGTPVENSTVELWSQFAFLNPGLLGSLDYFRQEFAAPIERHQDEEAARTLRTLVRPFILRRTKEQVAPELPPRSERVVYCDMEPAQRKLYAQYRDEYRALLLGMIEERGMNGSRMKVLEGLLRLRQICNHPCLVEKSYRGESAKFEVLMETLETLLSEGHKALVFSQFTQMLKVVRGGLDSRKIPYMYLDGRTINRQERVDSFQRDPEIPFFLISLKAGGVGLNLTAADYVIHIDPWWNPAVERQASDRTHRIGQENPVFVHKLIARDSVEEKMLELQERKKNLVAQLVTTENSFFKSLTAADVQSLFS